MWAMTEPTKPEPPKDIKLIPEENSMRIQWMPPYPPTGNVEKYEIRIGTRNGSIAKWTNQKIVSANDRSCRDPKAESHLMCAEIDGLESGNGKI